MSAPKPAKLAMFAVVAALGACLAIDVGRGGPRHGWWAQLGPVIPHESFPADCRSCHVPENWHTLVSDFEFDHEALTGVALNGAHNQALCLRCHNDRGPVTTFAERGCMGCHEDLHKGTLGSRCDECHTESTWQPVGQIALHDRTRFPLVGVHASVSCRRCHPGAEVGVFLPQDNECISCHASDLARANNPDHLALGFVNRCDSCHKPTFWNDAELDLNFQASAASETAAPSFAAHDPHAGFGLAIPARRGALSSVRDVVDTTLGAPGLSVVQVLTLGRR